MKKLTALFLTVFIISSVNAQLLWKVSGNGLSEPSYIMGTHHMAPLSILDSIAGYTDAFASTKQVIGEMDMTLIQTPEVMQLMQQMVMIDNDTILQSLFTPEECEVVNTAMKENLGLDITMGAKLKPAFLQNNLVILIFMKHIGGFNPGEQLDTYFQQMGASEGKKVQGLEAPEFQFNLLYNGSSLSRQAELLMCMLNDMDENLRLAIRLTNAYMAQDMKELEVISKMKHGNGCDPTPAEHAALVDTRNINWSNELPAIMEEAPAFVAVGALHLPGEKGLLNLLKQKGYTVEPVN